MRLRIGDKVKFKSTVRERDLKRIGVGIEIEFVNDDAALRYTEIANQGKVYNLHAGRFYSNNDVSVSFMSRGRITNWVMPMDWLEPAKKPGHHLTTIFK